MTDEITAVAKLTKAEMERVLLGRIRTLERERTDALALSGRLRERAQEAETRLEELTREHPGVIIIRCQNWRQGMRPQGGVASPLDRFHFLCPRDFTGLRAHLNKGKRVRTRACSTCKQEWWGPTLSELRESVI